MPRLVNSRSATLSWARRGKSTRSLGHHAPDAPNPLIVWAGAGLTSTVGARAAAPGDARTPRRATAWADDGPAGRTTAPTTAPAASSRWQRALPRPSPHQISTAHSTPGTASEWRLRTSRARGSNAPGFRKSPNDEPEIGSAQCGAPVAAPGTARPRIVERGMWCRASSGSLP